MIFRGRCTEMVEAWDLTPGDELPDGITVVSVQREATKRTVLIGTDEFASADLPGDSPVPVVRRRLFHVFRTDR